MPPRPPNEPEDALPSYLDRLTKTPLLNAEEERRLTKAAQAGDESARERLVEANMRLVINIARGYRSRQVPMEDLVQEGAIGLMQAAARYDPDRGFRFSTYATHWIRQAIGRAIDNKARSIRLPAHVGQSLRKIEKTRALLARELGAEPTADQLAAALGISPRKLQTLLAIGQDAASLDTPLGEGGATTLGALLRDHDATDANAEALKGEVRGELERILAELNERERRVMGARYRFDGREASPGEMEIELEIPRGRLRQIEAQAVRKLRAIARERGLGDVFGREGLDGADLDPGSAEAPGG